ncbi:MAG: leucyl aminopeptidase [Candidatus Puniceispirillales bacterium]
MFVNNRFVKFKFEKPNDNLKLNHENIINVLFYSEKNLLLSDGLSNEKNLAKFLKKIIENNLASTCIVRSERGIFLLINRKDHKSDLTNKYLEDLGGSIFNQTKSIGCSEVRIFENDQYLNRQIALGILLSSYKFNNYKKNKSKYTVDIKNVTFICDEPKKHSQNIQEIKNIANGVFTARDLVWQPPNILFPSSFANECKKLKKIGVKVTTYNEKQLEKLGMDALLAVGRGSRKDSQVVVMEWSGGKKETPPMAFIGKGVCFDSGGLSLKPPKSMEDMKWDMGGAATVTGLIETAALCKIKQNVIGVIGLVENMPDGDAQRPGDVVKSVSGQTIEVLNTDAEGRLVLADILSWTEKKFKPKFMIDLATLTGAMIVALGNIRAGLFSNNKDVSKAIFNAGEITGEKVWEMPMDDDYDQLIKTEIADMKNIGGPGAGSITAACFLKRHVEKTPWAHLDIAGVTWKNKSSPSVPYGGVGWGVKMLYQLIKQH